MVNKKGGIYLLIVFFISLLAFLGIIMLFQNFFFEEKTVRCFEGTLEGNCKDLRPYYCSNGTLVKNPEVCGCPRNISLGNTSNDCILKYSENPEDRTLFYNINGTRRSINFRVYSDVAENIHNLSKSITSSENTSLRDFKMRNINQPLQRNYLFPLVLKIRNESKNPTEQFRIAVSIVQNIPYGNSNKSFTVFGVKEVFNYSRYPYETIYENQGACGEKSELLAFLLKELGYSTVIFSYPEKNHEALGVACPKRYSLEKTGYCFIETTRPAIISSKENVYTSSFNVENPSIIHISEGKALPGGLKEYNDAKKFDNIINSVNLDGRINYFEKKKILSLSEEYSINWIKEIISI